MFDNLDYKLDVSKNPASHQEQGQDSNVSNLSLLGEVTTSASNQAKTIYNAATEVGAGLHLGQFDKATLTPQQSAPTMSTRWWAQEAGSLAVSLPLILATHKVVSAVVAPLESAVVKDVGQRAALMSTENFAVGRLAMTGAVYEGIFKPSGNNGNDSLAYSRLKQAGEGALSFAAMQITANHVSGSLSGVLGKVVTGTTAGAASGFVHEQSQSVFDQRRFASLPKSIDAAARGALLGTALSGLGMFKSVQAGEVAKSSPGADNFGQARFLTDRVFAGKDIVIENPSLKTARTFSNDGQHAQALPHLTRALEYAQRTFGPDSAEAARVLSDQARSNMFLGNSDVALTSADSALAIYRVRCGDRSPEAAEAWDQISAIHGRGGNFAQAADALDKSLLSGRGALADGKLDSAQKAEFEAEQGQRVQRLSGLYTRAGNTARAAQVLEEMPKPAPRMPELR